MMGIFSKRVNRTGAIAGMLTGIGSTLLYIFLYKGWFFIQGTAPLVEPQDWLLGINPQSFGAVGACLNFIVAFLVSRATEEVPEHIQQLVEDIRIPKGAGTATGH
jgi:cation/acetate symporter